MNASKLGCLPGCQAQLLVNNHKLEVSWTNFNKFPKKCEMFLIDKIYFRVFVPSQSHRSVNQHRAVTLHCGKLSVFFLLECSQLCPSHLQHQCRQPNTSSPPPLWFTRIGVLRLSSPTTFVRLCSVQLYLKRHMDFFSCSRLSHSPVFAWWHTMTKVSLSKHVSSGASRHTKLNI